MPRKTITFRKSGMKITVRECPYNIRGGKLKVHGRITKWLDNRFTKMKKLGGLEALVTYDGPTVPDLPLVRAKRKASAK